MRHLLLSLFSFFLLANVHKPPTRSLKSRHRKAR
jgi:hypothetical protein